MYLFFLYFVSRVTLHDCGFSVLPSFLPPPPSRTPPPATRFAFAVTVSITWRHARGLVAQQPTKPTKIKNTERAPKPALLTRFSLSLIVSLLGRALFKFALLSASPIRIGRSAAQISPMPYAWKSPLTSWKLCTVGDFLTKTLFFNIIFR